MPLIKVVWLQFAMQVFGGADSAPIWEKWGHMASELVPQSSSLGTLFTRLHSFLVRCTIWPQYMCYRQIEASDIDSTIRSETHTCLHL